MTVSGGSELMTKYYALATFMREILGVGDSEVNSVHDAINRGRYLNIPGYIKRPNFHGQLYITAIPPEVYRYVQEHDAGAGAMKFWEGMRKPEERDDS